MNGRSSRSGAPGPFPDVRWGRPDTTAARVAHRVAGTPAGSWLIRALVPTDRWLLVRTQGRYTVLGPLGTPLLLLTTTGARSGRSRTTPLVYVADGERILLAGSNFGQARHPAWSANLLAHPRATVAIGGRVFDVVAELLGGKERDQAWARFEATASTYRDYLSRTDREIRVFALQLAPGAGTDGGRE